MSSFVYRCPATGLNVQGWHADEVSPAEADSYFTITCLACQRVHLVNPITGKVFGTDKGDD
jgi:hypothetical protein